MTVTYSDVMSRELEQLRDAIGSTGMIDTMPDEFYQDLIDYGIETAEEFEDTYQGSYSSGAEFCQAMVEMTGDLEQVPDFITNHIDYDSMWECELRHDYFMLDGKRPGDKRFFSKYF
jgi:hypothetical protein